MAKRKGISKKLRFEVFKRDSFTCQYCGGSAPDVILHIDHIEPFSKGGENDILNLITACKDCNAGKSNRKLSEKTVIKVQKEQIEQLQEKREQLEMMYQWKKELLDIDESVIKYLSAYWSCLLPGQILTINGLNTLRKYKKKFSMDVIMDAMRIATNIYLESDAKGKLKQESVDIALKKIGAICSIWEKEKEHPGIKDLYYIRGILKNRFDNINPWYTLQMLEEAFRAGIPISKLKKHAIEIDSYDDFMKDIIEAIDYMSHNNEEECE